MSNFYCKIACGDPDFSIEEWNKAFHFCHDAGLNKAETDKILSPEPCKVQCEDCVNTVLDRQAETRKLMIKPTNE